jgi:deoxyribonuclease-4
VAIGATAIQIFTKTPNQWREPRLTADEADRFRTELARTPIRAVASHDSYLINLASPAPALRARSIIAVPGPTILIENTAGAGTALGSSFEELAELRERVRPELRERIGFCADTCHLHAAGHDLVNDWERVWGLWSEIVALEHLRCLHLNDSKAPLGSRRDRHAAIAEGTMGAEPFRRIMRDRRFRDVIKIIETPKGDDPVASDRRMLRRLRAYGRASGKR